MQVNKNSQVGRTDLPQIHWTDLLLAHPEFVSQYILEISEDKWECRCGNTHLRYLSNGELKCTSSLCTRGVTGFRLTEILNFIENCLQFVNRTGTLKLFG